MSTESFLPTWIGAIVNPAFIIRRELARTIATVAPSIQGSILDFGCGSKPYERLFTAATRYVGVDMEVTGHDHTNSKVDVFYDGRTLCFKEGEFDTVVAFEVFEHLFNADEIVKELHRVTRDGGYLLISIPFAWDEHEVPYDYARYTSFGITHFLRENGYELVQLKKTTTYVLAVFQMAIAYLIRISPRIRLVRWIRQVLLIFPLTLLAYIVDSVLPKRYEYYCNCVVLAQKM